VPKPIRQQLREHRKEWQQLYFALGEGRAADIEALKQVDVFEFFTRLQVWEEDIRAKIDATK
jgi:hypothetical protein